MKEECVGPANVDELLREMGADEFPHAHGRTLCQHLVGTRAILQRWRQPDWICEAGALHSIYGTDVYRRRLVAMDRRSEVRAAAGEKAERLAYLFGAISRQDLFRQMDSGGKFPAENLLVASQVEGGEDEPLSLDEAASLLVLHMANTAEQTCAADGSPALYLARLSRLGLIVRETGAIAPPVFEGCTQAVLPEDETAAIDEYAAGLVGMQSDRLAAIGHLTQAARICPWIAEPMVWLAYLNLQQGKQAEARGWIERAEKICSQWGAAWDKRLSYEQWQWLIDFIATQAVESEVGPLPAPGDSQRLQQFVEQLEKRNWVEFYLSPPIDGSAEGTGAHRFHRYVASFADADSASSMKIYPGLPARAWHEPGEFPLAAALEAEADAIRREILALDDGQFAPESEPIPRTGNWNVLFFHERGRRNEEVSARCPVTSRVIESCGALRTLAGLCYVSRLAPGTHIAAHRGPTNLRLRCHLGIRVPEGNCAIRVDGQTRQWQEGRCLVFDDFLTHEAWNHTAAERLVLIVDLWHPHLTGEEVALITGLHHYAAAQAASLSAYWSANEKARSLMDDRGH